MYDRKENESLTWIISRHLGAVEWIKSKGFDGQIVDQFDGTVVPGDKYIGTLPVPMIADILDSGAEFILLVLPNLPADARGKELTPAMMDEYGASLIQITHIETEVV